MIMIAITIIRFGRGLAFRAPRVRGVAALRPNLRIGEGPGLPASGRCLRAMMGFLKVPVDVFAMIVVYA